MKLWLAGIVFLFSINQTCQAQQYNFYTISVEDGLPQSNVYDAIQMPDGSMAIATANGLSRYNGSNIINYGLEAGLPGNTVRSLMLDRNHQLWIGTKGGILITDGVTSYAIKDTSELRGSTVLCLAQDSSGKIWAGTDDGGINIISYEPTSGSKKIKYLSVENGLSSNTIFDFHIDRLGRIWVATLYGGINIITPLSDSTYDIRMLVGHGHIPSDLILCIEEDHLGNLWFGSYDAGAFKIEQIYDETPVVITFDKIHKEAVWDIYSASNKDLWFASGEHGATRISFNRNGIAINATDFNMDNGLPSNQILCINEDREGNIWLGTNGDGISRFGGDRFVHYTTKEGLLTNQIHGVEQDQYGNLWLATDGGGLAYINLSNEAGKMVYNYTQKDGLTSDYLTSISLGNNHNNQNIWLSTVNHGIVKFDGKIFKNIDESYGLEENRVNHVFVDSKGIVWCSTANSISKWDGRRFVNVSMEMMKISDEGVKYIAEDAEGTIWFATAGALGHYEGEDHIVTYDQVEGLTFPDVNTLAIHPNGDVWIGTNGGGLFRLLRKENKIVEIELNKELSSSIIESMSFLNDTVLIVGTAKGFDKLLLNQDQSIKRIRSYDQTDGFSGLECNDNAIFKDIKGRVWFGTVKGVTVYNPSKENQNPPLPIVNIVDLRLAFKEVDWLKQYGLKNRFPWTNLPTDLELNYFDNHLTFYFSAISFSNPEKIRYRYKLEGQSDQWSPASNDHKVTFSGLSPGDYTLVVQAVNADGAWSESKIYPFAITPPWYQTIWFYTLCVIIFITSVFFYIQWREAKLKKEKKILEDKVAERTAEVVHQKEEIEAKNEEITDSINYASKIQTAILPREEDVNKFLVEHFVLFKPKDIVSGDFYWIERKGDKVFFTAADCTGHGVPGAFMSMIGTALLNEALAEKNITQPDKILYEVRKGIITSLRQTGADGEQKDGMDMSLCALDTKTNILEFSGANNPLYLIRKADSPAPVNENGETIEVNLEEFGCKLYEFKASKQPVGYYTAEKMPYNYVKVQLQKGDTIYSFSDGLPDQFGGPKGKKFKYKTFKLLLLEIQSMPMSEQKKLLDNTIVNWMREGNTEQIDDICVLGVKI